MKSSKKFIKVPVLLPEENHQANPLTDIILGGQDGLVNVLGLLLGVAAASCSARIVLAAGFAAAFAESISMAAVAYTSNVAARDFYLRQMEKEKREMKEIPEIEREEIRQIYREKGFKGHLLEEVVRVITSDDKVWLDTMMQEELKLAPIEKNRPFQAALIVGLSTIVGSFIPLFPFLLLPLQAGVYFSIIISAIVLFLVGVIKAKVTVGHWGKSGLEMTIIGIVSAVAGYGVGLLFQVANQC